MTTDHRAEAEKHLANAARHLTEHPGDMRIAEVSAAIGQGYAILALLDARQDARIDHAADVARRFRITDRHLAQVADVYKRAAAGGQGPTRAVANYFDVAHSTAAKWAGHARSRGFLPATVAGRQS